MVSRLLDEPTRPFEPCPRLVRTALDDFEPGPFQVDVTLVKTHPSALGDLLRLVEVGEGGFGVLPDAS